MNKPLVSVVVVTYNSSKYILETLESIKNQTYNNMELIITDDCSSDDTVQLCKDWLLVNKDRFEGSQIITSPKNTGISPNINRGFYAAQGEWIKQIAGDDRLKNTCLEHYVDFILNNRVDILFSPLDVFGEGDIEHWKKLIHSNFKYIFSLSDKDFKILLCKIDLFPAPAAFIRTSFFKKVNGYNESIKFIEDWPFWVKAAFNGAKFDYIDSNEVDYRVNSSSVSQSSSLSPRFKKSLLLTEKHNLSYMKKISILYAIEGLFVFKKQYSANMLWRIFGFLRLLNPYYWKARKIYNCYLNN